MARRNLTESIRADAAYVPVLQLWALRVLTRCNGMERVVKHNCVCSRRVIELLGHDPSTFEAYPPARCARELTAQAARLEAAPPTVPRDTVVAHNIARLAARLGLNAVEQDILHLAIAQKLFPDFNDALETAGDLTLAKACAVFAACLDRPLPAIRAALDDDGRLARTALLTLDARCRHTFESKVDVLEGLADALTLEHEDLLGLFRYCLAPSPAARLTLDGFEHLSQDIEILTTYVTGASRRQRPGVNVLLHGQPGTGKTEFVRALAHHTGLKLLEIPTEEAGGKPRAGKARFEAFRFAQSLLGGTEPYALLFDEVEDVFSNSRSTRFDEGNISGVKGWVNQLLERNPVPTFWVTNHLRAIDPAYRRRFDYVLEMGVPPASVRRRLIDEHTCGLPLPEAWRERAAQHAQMVPAVIERAAQVGRLVCDAMPSLAPEQVMTRLMNNTLDALGVMPLQLAQDPTESDYRLELLNADCDLAQLREGLGRIGEGRLCLYGPPGTGKTAFGRHLAQALDKPLLVKRASDILSPYLGVAEKNIAGMFAEATQQEAVLLLDEADSLLRDRQGAQRSWEVTQVNEMLTQMESFRGIFITSTNLMDSLDTAAMRRFDAIVRLGYLKDEQAWQMFEALSAQWGLAADAPVRQALARLPHLTPGDFAATARLARLNPPTDAQQLVLRLSSACEAKKEPARRPMGFLC